MFKGIIQSARARRGEDGQGLVEYALILVLVAVVVIVILAALGPAIGNIFSQVNTALAGTSSSQLTVEWLAPAEYRTADATGTYKITFEGSPAVGASLGCTNGFKTGGGDGGIYFVIGPRGAGSTCTVSYNGASTNFPVSFGA